MKTASDERLARSRARRAWPISRHELEWAPGANLSESTTAAERLAMMWELALQSWLLAGRPLPEYSRSEIPGKISRLDE